MCPVLTRSKMWVELDSRPFLEFSLTDQTGPKQVQCLARPDVRDEGRKGFTGIKQKFCISRRLGYAKGQ